MECFGYFEKSTFSNELRRCLKQLEALIVYFVNITIIRNYNMSYPKLQTAKMFKRADLRYCIVPQLGLQRSVVLCKVLVLGLSSTSVRSVYSQCIFLLMNLFISWSDWRLFSQNCGKICYEKLQVGLKYCFAVYHHDAHIVLF